MKRWFSKLDLEITPIVAYGLVLCGVILAGIALDDFSKAAQQKKQVAEQARLELANLSTLETDGIWQRRLEAALAERKKMDAKMWRGATAGGVAAEFQQSIQMASAAAKATNLRMSVDPEPEIIDGVSILPFSYRATIPDADHFVDLLSAITVQNRMIFTRDLSVSFTGARGSVVTFTGVIPIKIVKPQAPNNGARQ